MIRLAGIGGAFGCDTIPAHAAPLQRLLPALTIAAAFAAALFWSWDRWPDVLIDSGRELYVPWRLARGDLLYRDVASFYGPFSSYFNAGVFMLLGPSLRSLVIVNLLVIAGVLAMLYRLARQFTGRPAATLAAATFALLLGFNQYSWVGGNNWVLPYSHELTHGVALALASLCSLLAFSRGGSRKMLLIAGFTAGLTFLTKPEPFVATLATNGVLLAMILPRRKQWAGDAAAWALAALAPLLVSILAFSAVVPLGDALANTAGAWRYVLTETQARHDFHRRLMGVDAPLDRSIRLLIWAGGYTLLLGLPAYAGRWVRRGERAVGAGVFVATAAAMTWAVFHGWIHWSGLLLPLPLAMVFLLWSATAEWRRSRDHASLGRLGLAVLGLALLARIILNVDISLYGYLLGAPAITLAVAVMFGSLPAGIRRRGGSSLPFLAVAAAGWMTVVAVFVFATTRQYAGDTVVVGSGGDAFVAPPDRALAVNAVLEQIALHTGPADTLVALPEGVMLNFLSRRRNSTPFVSFMPSELSMFGEDRILAALEAHPPEVIALVHKDTAEYGPRFFGKDYGQRMYHWVMANYSPRFTAGDEPFAGEGFGIMLLQRNGPATAPGGSP